jgi:hypothetical protein
MPYTKYVKKDKLGNGAQSGKPDVKLFIMFSINNANPTKKMRGHICITILAFLFCLLEKE